MLEFSKSLHPAAVPSGEPIKVDHSPFVFELSDACRKPGCPVCCLSHASPERYLEALFYEYVNDPETRKRLVKSLGFCREHADLLLETRIADVLGASIIYENIVRDVLRNLPNAAIAPVSGLTREQTRPFKKLINSSPRSGHCIACEHEETAAERVLNELGKSIIEEKIRSALGGSDGLCFPHLAQLLERIDEPQAIGYLLSLTQKKLETLQSEMSELIRKHDYRFQSEGVQEQEALAWRKAMRMISGAGHGRTDS
jgi:hypothetical protein